MLLIEIRATTPWLALLLLVQYSLKRLSRLDFKQFRKINKISGVGYPAPDFCLRWECSLKLIVAECGEQKHSSRYL